MIRLLTLSLVLFSVALVTGADIELRKRANPTGTVIRLGDIADIRADSPEEERRLSAVLLMPSPAEGTVEYLRLQAVRDMLGAHGETLMNHRFTGEKSVAIGMPTQQFASEATPEQWTRSERLAEQMAQPRQRWNSTGFRTRSTSKATSTNPLAPTRRQQLTAKQQVRQAIESWLATQGEAGKFLAVGDIQIEASELERVHYYSSEMLIADPRGYTRAEPGMGQFVIAPIGGDASYAKAQLLQLVPVVTSTGSIRRGQLITAARVLVTGMLPKDVEDKKGEPFVTLESVLGRIASSTIREDEILTSSNTTTPLLVRRNEAVTIITGSNGITVRMGAKAKEEGRLGDLVMVQTFEKEILQARVSGRSELTMLGTGTFSAELASRNLPGGLR